MRLWAPTAFVECSNFMVNVLIDPHETSHFAQRCTISNSEKITHSLANLSFRPINMLTTPDLMWGIWHLRRIATKTRHGTKGSSMPIERSKTDRDIIIIHLNTHLLSSWPTIRWGHSCKNSGHIAIESLQREVSQFWLLRLMASVM